MGINAEISVATPFSEVAITNGDYEDEETYSFGMHTDERLFTPQMANTLSQSFA
jgi:hypothetical protein